MGRQTSGYFQIRYDWVNDRDGTRPHVEKVASHRKTQHKHPKCVYIYICILLFISSRSVCRQYLDVTAQLLDICVYVT